MEETSANYDIRVVRVFFNLGMKFRGNWLVQVVVKAEERRGVNVADRA